MQKIINSLRHWFYKNRFILLGILIGPILSGLDNTPQWMTHFFGPAIGLTVLQWVACFEGPVGLLFLLELNLPDWGFGLIWVILLATEGGVLGFLWSREKKKMFLITLIAFCLFHFSCYYVFNKHFNILPPLQPRR